MPRVAKQLSHAAVRALKHSGTSDKPEVYNVGGEGVRGLLLQISPSGARSWLLRFTIGGKVRHMGLGPYAECSLADVREAAREARRAIREGRDPIEERKAQRRAHLTFEEAAEKYHKDVKSPTLRSERSRANWIAGLEQHAYPVMGHLSVSEIELRHVLEVLEPLWPRPHATYLRSNVEAVLGWATVRGYRDGDNPARWKGNLEHVLSSPGKVHRVKHHAALPYQEVPAFLADLRKQDSTAARALEFLILSAARSGEVRLSTWQEFDLDAKLWTIPEERMKSGKTHRVPLSAPALKLLESLPHREGLLFARMARGKERPLWDHEIALKLGRQTTVHGFRSSFKDWCRSCTAYADEISELQLAHVSTDATRAAYARDELLPKRERLLEQWAKFLESDEQADAKVTEIGKVRA